MKKKWTGERLETYIFSKDSIDHLHRYSIVSNYINNKIVLDIACGEGYGSNIISNTAKFVYGVDIDSSSIYNAKSKYRNNNIEFLVGNTSNIPIENNSIDVVVSFETIEHHDEHVEMMNEIRRVLKPNGLLIISTPDKLNYTDKRNFTNQFHVKELYKQEFIGLIVNYFSNIQILNQKYINGNSLIEEDDSKSEIQIFSGSYSNTYTAIINPYYIIIIASNDDFEKQKATIFDGYQIIKVDMENRLNEVYSSFSYKIGNFILMPYKFFKKFLR